MCLTLATLAIRPTMQRINSSKTLVILGNYSAHFSPSLSLSYLNGRVFKHIFMDLINACDRLLM